jgi:hypothetical protein
LIDRPPFDPGSVVARRERQRRHARAAARKVVCARRRTSHGQYVVYDRCLSPTPTTNTHCLSCRLVFSHLASRDTTDGATIVGGSEVALDVGALGSSLGHSAASTTTTTNGIRSIDVLFVLLHQSEQPSGFFSCDCSSFQFERYRVLNVVFLAEILSVFIMFSVSRLRRSHVRHTACEIVGLHV